MNLFGPVKGLGEANDANKRLAKTLSWPHLIALGIGAIIGTGIYTLTGVGAAVAGPGLIISFAIAGVVCALAALEYAELSTLIPTAGSAYTYTYTAIGEIAAWVVGWALILEYSLACSAVAVGWSAHLIGWLHEGLGINIPQFILKGPTEGGFVNLPAVLVSLSIMGILLIGARESATLNIILVIIKIVALAAFVIVVLPAINAGNYNPLMPFGFWAHEINGEKYGVMAAAAIVCFAFFGFDAVSTSAEETKNPGRDLTIGILGSVIGSTIIYMLVAAVAVGALNYNEIANSGEPLPHVLRSINHPLIAALVGGAAIIALPSVILVMMYGQSRIFFVMSRDGLLPEFISRVGSRGVPVLVTILTGIFISIFAGFVPLKRIAELTNVGTLIAFISVGISLIILRRKYPNIKRKFKVPLYYIISPLSIIGCLYLLYSLPRESQLFTIIWLALGLCIYFAYGYRHSSIRK